MTMGQAAQYLGARFDTWNAHAAETAGEFLQNAGYEEGVDPILLLTLRAEVWVPNVCMYVARMSSA
jgi:hypothetical protein